jgi:Ca-activated chloride channel family protein
MLPDFSNVKNVEMDIPASQGFLRVELTSNTINNNLNSKIKCIVRPAGVPKTVLLQNINTIEKYLSGKYDLEVLTLPRINIRNVEVTQSTTTTVKVEVPGVLSISKTYAGYGGIFVNDNGRLLKIYDLNETLSNELVGLQAGDYTLVYRSKLSKKTSESVRRNIHIKSGESVTVKL